MIEITAKMLSTRAGREYLSRTLNYLLQRVGDLPGDESSQPVLGQGGGHFTGDTSMQDSYANKPFRAQITAVDYTVDANGLYSWQMLTPDPNNGAGHGHGAVWDVYDSGMTGSCGSSTVPPVAPAYEANNNPTPLGAVVNMRRSYPDTTYDWVYVFDAPAQVSGVVSTDTVYTGTQVFEGPYFFGVTAGQWADLTAGLTHDEQAKLNNLNACQLQVLLTELTVPQIKTMINIPLSGTQISNFVSVALTGQINPLYPTVLTGSQLNTLSSRVTPTQMSTFYEALTPTQIQTLTAGLSTTQLRRAGDLPARELNTLVNTLTTGQLQRVLNNTPGQAWDPTRTPVVDVDYTALATDRLVAYPTLTATRTVSLPSSVTLPNGYQLEVQDESGNASPSVKLRLLPFGTNGINGTNAATDAVTVPYGRATVETDGAGSWFLVRTGANVVTSVSNSDSTLTISPTVGAVVASLNLAHANTWTVGQTVSLATSIAAWTAVNPTAATSSSFPESPYYIWQTNYWNTSTPASEVFQWYWKASGGKYPFISSGGGLNRFSLNISNAHLTSQIAYFDTSGNFLVTGWLNATGQSVMSASVDADVVLALRGFSPTQSGDLQQWQTNGAVPVANMTATGNLVIATTLTVNSQAYIWPGSVPAGTTYLSNDGSNNLSWASSVAGSLTPLFDHYADGASVGTGETDLYSDTIAGGTMAASGDKLHAVYGAILVNSTSTKQVRVYFAGTLIFDSGALTISASSEIVVTVDIIRNMPAGGGARYAVGAVTTGASTGSYASVGTLAGIDWTVGNILKITGQAGGVGPANGDITAKIGEVYKIAHA